MDGICNDGFQQIDVLNRIGIGNLVIELIYA